MNAIELFEKIYNEELKEDECIEILHPEEKNHYILRDKFKSFDRQELISCLMFKEYKFKIVNQEEVMKKLEKQKKLQRIEELKKELKELEENI